MPDPVSPPALRRALPALTGAVVCALAAALVGLLALVVPGTHAADGSALRGLMELDRDRTHLPLELVAHIVDPLPFAVASLILFGVAVARRRWRVALLLPVLLIGSGATTQVLKRLLATPRIEEFLGRDQIGPAAWPSGHSTAAMALALALVLVVPRAWRPPAAVAGGALAVAVGLSTVALSWHFPSDVAGGFLVAAVWALGVIAVLRGADEHEAPAPRRAWTLAIAMLGGGALAAVGLVTAAALASPEAGSALARPAALAAIAGIAALAAAIPLGTSRAAGT